MKRKALALAVKMGIEITITPDGIYADAPKGQVFRSTGGHVICGYVDDAEPPSAAWPGIVEDIQPGLQTCDLPDCDICNSLT